MLEKLPQALLSQYYRCIEKGEAWSLLKSCVTGLLRMLSTRYKDEQLSMVFPVMEMHEERAQPSLISGPQKRNVINLEMWCVQGKRTWKEVGDGEETWTVLPLLGERAPWWLMYVKQRGWKWRMQGQTPPVTSWGESGSSVYRGEGWYAHDWGKQVQYVWKSTRTCKEEYCLAYCSVNSETWGLRLFSVSWTKAVIRRMLTRMW